MIEILLNDKAYEQDIRELLMAFYPGEIYSHEPSPQSDFSVEGMVDQAKRHVSLKVVSHKRQEIPELAEKVTEAVEEEVEHVEEAVEVNDEKRLETKSRIKRRL